MSALLVDTGVKPAVWPYLVESLICAVARRWLGHWHVSHDNVSVAAVAVQYVQTARRMVRELHAGGHDGGLGELSPAVIVEYWLGLRFPPGAAHPGHARRVRRRGACAGRTDPAASAGTADQPDSEPTHRPTSPPPPHAAERPDQCPAWHAHAGQPGAAPHIANMSPQDVPLSEQLAPAGGGSRRSRHAELVAFGIAITTWCLANSCNTTAPSALRRVTSSVTWDHLWSGAPWPDTRRSRCKRFFAILGSGTCRRLSRGATPEGSCSQAGPSRRRPRRRIAPTIPPD